MAKKQQTSDRLIRPLMIAGARMETDATKGEKHLLPKERLLMAIEDIYQVISNNCRQGLGLWWEFWGILRKKMSCGIVRWVFPLKTSVRNNIFLKLFCVPIGLVNWFLHLFCVRAVLEIQCSGIMLVYAIKF